MKLFKYSPGDFEDLVSKEIKTSPFSGFVEIEMPTYKERVDINKDIALDKKDGKKVDKTAALIALVEGRVKRVDLTIDGGEKFESIDDIGVYKEGTELINYIGTMILTGIPLGEPSKPTS